MHEYDIALKRILTRPGSALLAALTGSYSLHWLNVELPEVSNRRVDLLGEDSGGRLIHIELQSRNEKDFAVRMGEYLFAIARRYGRIPSQVVLYVGRSRPRMQTSVEAPGLSYRFHVVDIRDLDGERLLASPHLCDNVSAVLTRLGGEPGTVRLILGKIAAGPEDARAEALTELAILAQLRELSAEIRREVRRMPIHLSLRDHDIFGPEIRQWETEARAEGQLEILLGQVERRFGPISSRLRKRLAGLGPERIKAASLRILDADSPEDLFTV